MTLRFNIEYYAAAGERLWLLFEDGAEYAMQSCAEGQWRLDAECDARAAYRYELRDAAGATLRREWGVPHRLVAGRAERMTVFDRWSERPEVAPLYSSFFTRGVFRRLRPSAAVEASADEVVLRVEAPSVASDEAVGVMGAVDALGAWNVGRIVAMSDGEAPVWSVALPRSMAGSEYKFVVLDAATHRLKRYEEGFNRRIPEAGEGVTLVGGLRLRDGGEPWRGAGVAVPLFSLRSERGWGCGELGDLRLMADWAAATDMSVVQLLPVNDTSTRGSWRDSYPYNAVSSFALHPMYAGALAVVEACAACRGGDDLRREFDGFAEEGRRLNELPAVDYEATVRLKNAFLRRAYELCGEEMLSSDEYHAFAAANDSWLFPYTVFCALRDEHGTAEFGRWGAMAEYDEARARAYARKNATATGFYGFVQYLLDGQLREAHDYARSRGVLLKGDIPIGVSPASVDVWRWPDLFNLDVSAGAPPDDFAAEGQNWGFPTYNWARMAEDGYAWWRSRLSKMAEYFDAYRMDHILGFFRIWEVPRAAASALLGRFNPSLPYTAEEIRAFGFKFDASRHAARDLRSTDVLFLEDESARGRWFPRIEGFRTEAFAALDEVDRAAYRSLYEDFYYRRHNDFWRDCALRRLPVLTGATGMLACGEDLGMIPACVPEVMREEQILALEIERMPKRLGEAFGDTAHYPYLSVASTSTHDTSTLRGWWREDRAATVRYWREVLRREGDTPHECTGDAAREIVRRHMLSPAMLAILPLQDYLAMDESLRAEDPDAERINIPADADHYWRYRMHLTLEELLAAEEFGGVVRGMTALRRRR